MRDKLVVLFVVCMAFTNFTKPPSFISSLCFRHRENPSSNIWFIRGVTCSSFHCKVGLVRCVNTYAMHVDACMDYMEMYIMLPPNHAFSYNIVVLHHQLHVMFFYNVTIFQELFFRFWKRPCNSFLLFILLNNWLLKLQVIIMRMGTLVLKWLMLICTWYQFFSWDDAFKNVEHQLHTWDFGCWHFFHISSICF
jgi:hypothetical protein